MRTTLLKKLLSLSLALTLLLGCASYALAWEPQWAHDEDLSDYRLCENFGDITLKVAVTDHATISTWEENAFVKWLEEVTNVDLTFELIPYEGRAEKLGLILNSGNYPDVFLSCGMTDAMILPHYQKTRYFQLDGLRLFEDITYSDSMGRRFYALPDGSYLLGRHGKEELRGEAYLIQDGILKQISRENQRFPLDF